MHNFYDRSVDTNWTLFKEKVLSLIEKYVPRIVITSNLQSPWFSQSLKRLRNKKKRIFSSAKVTGTQERWSDYQAVATEYKQALKDAKDSFFNTTLPSLLITNPKQFWNVVNKRDNSSITLKDANNRIIKLDESANVLNSVFVSAFSQNVCSVTPTYASSNFLTMDPIVFDAAGIEKNHKKSKSFIIMWC